MQTDNIQVENYVSQLMWTKAWPTTPAFSSHAASFHQATNTYLPLGLIPNRGQFRIYASSQLMCLLLRNKKPIV